MELRPSRRRKAATVTTTAASSSRSDDHHAIVATRNDDSDRLVATRGEEGYFSHAKVQKNLRFPSVRVGSPLDPSCVWQKKKKKKKKKNCTIKTAHAVPFGSARQRPKKCVWQIR